MTGISFSPNSIANSVTRFLALSSSASTVEFCTLNSFVTDVASSNDCVACFCCHFTISTLPAKVAKTCEARAPFSPMFLKTGASTSMLPSFFNCCNNIKSPSLVLRFNALLSSSKSMPVAFAILLGSLNKFMMSCERAVADISHAWPWLSNTAAKAMICGIVIPACAPTPAMRLPNSAR